MEEVTSLGTERVINGRRRVYYYGYWIRAYEVPADTLLTKKRLIDALTRRLFNHVEHGINVPGPRLDDARASYDNELDERRRRVKGAMLAGALFNRTTDIFTKLVELQGLGVRIGTDNALMQECGEHLKEAMELGKLVRHRSGAEGIDELWGEPLKAFLLPVEEFYRSRYIKISQTMRAIDSMCDELIEALRGHAMFHGAESPIRAFGEAAKVKSETLRTDEDQFEVWSTFVVSGEVLGLFVPTLADNASPAMCRVARDGHRLMVRARELIFYIARARVQMPKSTSEFVAACREFAARGAVAVDHPGACRMPGELLDAGPLAGSGA